MNDSPLRVASKVSSQGAYMNSKGSRISSANAVRTAVPYILLGGALGALIGSALGSTANGIRVGVILGGSVAFVLIQRRKARDS